MKKTLKHKKPETKIAEAVDPSFNRVFLQLIPGFITKMFIPALRGIAGHILHFFPELKKNLTRIGFTISADDYVATALLNYSLLGGVLGLLMMKFALVQEKTLVQSLTLGMAVGVLLVFLLLFLAVKHPVSVLTERAVNTDKYLLYSLRDLSLQISSGGTVYDALTKTSLAPYGEASAEFRKLVSEMYVGIPMQKVLRKNIDATKSEFLRKVYWQLINSLESGADLRSGLTSVITELDERQKSHIQNYARELSLWSLLYMMFAVAVPTIGLTMMVILSAFAGFGLTQGSFIFFIVMAFFAQIALIYFVKSRRPVVEF